MSTQKLMGSSKLFETLLIPFGAFAVDGHSCGLGLPIQRLATLSLGLLLNLT